MRVAIYRRTNGGRFTMGGIARERGFAPKPSAFYHQIVNYPKTAFRGMVISKFDISFIHGSVLLIFEFDFFCADISFPYNNSASQFIMPTLLSSVKANPKNTDSKK